MTNPETDENETGAPETTAKDKGNAHNGGRAIKLFSAEFLMKNPAGVSFVLSSIFLVAGASFNLGLFFFIDTKLVSVLSLADHISTSISVSLTLVALSLLLGLLSTFLLGILLMILSLFDYFVKDSASAESGSEPKDPKQKVSGYGQFLQDHALIIYPALFNVLLSILIYFIMPDEIQPRFETLSIFLLLVGAIALVLYVQHTESDRDKEEYLRFAGIVILLYLIPFQLGVFESISGYNFIYEKDHTREFSINDFEEVHLLKAGSNGVFYSVKPVDRKTPGSIRFEPWSKINNLSYQPRVVEISTTSPPEE